MNTKVVTVVIDSNEQFMLKEFVEYGGIEFYEHQETIYKLLDKLADQTVRTHCGENKEMQQEIRDMIWDYCVSNCNVVRREVILCHVKERFFDENKDTENFYYNFEEAVRKLQIVTVV